ncbi:MAG: SIS domain-containing protein [Candidatus Omnitrophota bacterium]|nr:SIS domain-containing protein [Candidatus Omnitrophota bacterium]
MKEKIHKIIRASIKINEELLKNQTEIILKIAQACINCIKNNGKIILFGNGGSAADSQHVAAEFVGRFKKERKGIPAIALTTNSSILTAIGNDYGFKFIFSRQIESLAKNNDLAIAISTSGNSENVILGVKLAKKMKLKTVSLTGGNGGGLTKITDISLVILSNNTARIQEAHILCLHAICEIVEEVL